MIKVGAYNQDIDNTHNLIGLWWDYIEVQVVIIYVTSSTHVCV